MFHEGDLRSGIALSLTQNKLLTCFICDDEQDTSTAWEALLNRNAALLAEKTVLLKFALGSQEASYLSTFCLVKQAPTIVVIRYGAVLDKLEPPLTETELSTRLNTAMTGGASAVPQASGELGSPHDSEQTTTSSPPPQEPSTTTTPPVSATTSIQSLLPDRAARLKADKETKEAADKAERVARSEARRKEAEAAVAATASGEGKQRVDAKELGRQEVRADWIKQQAKRKETLLQEHDRIMQSIESDRQERRHRAASKKENVAASEPLLKPKQSTASSASTGVCNIQVRLPHGSTIRQRFQPNDTLAVAVREWIKQSVPAEDALRSYTIKLLQPPQPSRSITAAEEQETLAELGMLPSATLILVERPGGNLHADGSLLGRLMMLFHAILASITAALSFVLGIGSNNSPQQSAEQGTQADGVIPDVAASRSSGVDGRSGNASQRTKTLADSRPRDDDDSRAEFYNGNSSAFEGRKDD